MRQGNKSEENKTQTNRSVARFFGLMILPVILMLSLQANAQTQEDDENDEESFGSDLGTESFSSDLKTSQGSRSIDYNNADGINRNSKSYDMYEKMDMNKYKFEEGVEEQSNRNQTNMNIQGGGTFSQGTPELKQPGSSSIPSVVDPFRQGQTGVKAPRNIDAVPDNGDEPNDVPLDGGIGILALAAAAWGMKRKK